MHVEEMKLERFWDSTAEVIRKCSEKLVVMLLLSRTWMEWKGLLTPLKVLRCLRRHGCERGSEDTSLLL